MAAWEVPEAGTAPVTVLLRLQEKQSELACLLRAQQQELSELREQQLRLEDRLPPSPRGGEKRHKSNSSVESQLHDLVLELRKIQQGQQQERQGADVVGMGMAQELMDVAEGTASMLKDLREERGLVAEMLDGVRQEKCEVIAMMHSFAMDKSDALQELEGLRRAARDEIVAALSSGPRKAGGWQYEANEVCAPVEILTASMLGLPPAVPQPPAQTQSQSHSVQPSQQGRQPSRPSLAASGAVMPTVQQLINGPAPRAAQPTSVSIGKPTSVSLTNGGGATVRTAAPTFLMSHQTTLVQSRDVLNASEPGRRARSPVRQTVLTSNATSPSIVARGLPMDLMRSGKQLPVGDCKQSPVRRFVSAGRCWPCGVEPTAGVTPRVHDQPVAGSTKQGWTAGWPGNGSPIVLARG